LEELFQKNSHQIDNFLDFLMEKGSKMVEDGLIENEDPQAEKSEEMTPWDAADCGSLKYPDLELEKKKSSFF
jgi:hypothetical protein